MAHYESDVTKFLRQMHEKKPSLDAEQRAGRAIFWDKQLDADRAGALEGLGRGDAGLRLPDQDEVARWARRDPVTAAGSRSA